MDIPALWRKLKLRYGSQKTVINTLRAMGVRIGQDCRIYTANFGPEPWLIRIGNRVCISNDVSFINHDLNWPLQQRHQSLTGFGVIDIKDNCQIGLRATILPRVTIGPNAIVGACSVVTRDIPPNTVAAGNPARVICSLDEYEAKCLARHIDIPKNRAAARALLEAQLWQDAPP